MIHWATLMYHYTCSCFMHHCAALRLLSCTPRCFHTSLHCSQAHALFSRIPTPLSHIPTLLPLHTSPRCCHASPHCLAHPRTVSYIPTLLSCILCCSYALPSFLHCHCLCHHCRCCCRVVIVRQMDESRHRKNSNEQEHLLLGKHMDGQFTTQKEFKKARAFTN
jgi:hypothetical protein